MHLKITDTYALKREHLFLWRILTEEKICKKLKWIFRPDKIKAEIK